MDILDFELTEAFDKTMSKRVTSIDPIYYPVMSTLGLYRVSVDILQKDARDVSFAAVYYDACIKLYINTNGIAFAKGFNGLTRRYATTPLSGNPDGFSFIGVDRFKDVYGGTLYTTLTDNKTFFFTAVCMVNGEMSWGVESTSPTLPEETKKKIFDHAVSLGFNREDFTELKYDTCKN
ncbi:unnamed protein product [Orchesella dallaii]|uniref:Lipocalin/cytosolic fatty-acid binding domain-containing protein n=1 Tax=Orchesella dallaii TaxID=48710 RepID=A0ABP1QI50_9HEXA